MMVDPLPLSKSQPHSPHNSFEMDNLDPCHLAQHAEAARAHAPRFATLLDQLSRAIDHGVQKEVADLCQSVGVCVWNAGCTGSLRLLRKVESRPCVLLSCLLNSLPWLWCWVGRRLPASRPPALPAGRRVGPGDTQRVPARTEVGGTRLLPLTRAPTAPSLSLPNPCHPPGPSSVQPSTLTLFVVVEPVAPRGPRPSSGPRVGCWLPALLLRPWRTRWTRRPLTHPSLGPPATSWG